MERRTFLAMVSGSLLAAPLAVEAQNPAKAVRIGRLGLASPGPEVLRIVDAFAQGLRQFGYVEGQNVAFEYRWAPGRSERLPDLAAELVLLKVDTIAVANTLGVLAAKQATSTMPIIFLGADPDALGFGSRLARPGGNITTVTLVAGPEVGGETRKLKPCTRLERDRGCRSVREETAPTCGSTNSR